MAGAQQVNLSSSFVMIQFLNGRYVQNAQDRTAYIPDSKFDCMHPSRGRFVTGT